MPEMQWYQLIEQNPVLQQGDLLFSIPIISPVGSISGDRPKMELREYDGIVLSQSCDLEHGKIDVVVFCPFFPLDEVIEKIAGSTHVNALKSAKNKLRVGDYIHYHLLNKCEFPDFLSDYFVVDLKNPRTFPIDQIPIILTTNRRRLRLVSPFREQLSQVFARVFMRVGLPEDIPEFT
jgi:hypothetical protein